MFSISYTINTTSTTLQYESEALSFSSSPELLPSIEDLQDVEQSSGWWFLAQFDEETEVPLKGEIKISFLCNGEELHSLGPIYYELPKIYNIKGKMTKKLRNFFNERLWHVDKSLDEGTDDIVIFIKERKIFKIRMFILLDELPKVFLDKIKEKMEERKSKKSIRFLPDDKIAIMHHYVSGSKDLELPLNSIRSSLSTMLVKDLKLKLKEIGLNSSGVKAELVNRLKSAIEKKNKEKGKVKEDKKETEQKPILKNEPNNTTVTLPSNVKKYEEMLLENTFNNSNVDSYRDIDNLSITDIRAQLKKLGLKTNGLRRNLINRLRSNQLNNSEPSDEENNDSDIENIKNNGDDNNSDNNDNNNDKENISNNEVKKTINFQLPILNVTSSPSGKNLKRSRSDSNIEEHISKKKKLNNGKEQISSGSIKISNSNTKKIQDILNNLNSNYQEMKEKIGLCNDQIGKFNEHFDDLKNNKDSINNTLNQLKSLINNSEYST